MHTFLITQVDTPARDWNPSPHPVPSAATHADLYGGTTVLRSEFIRFGFCICGVRDGGGSSLDRASFGTTMGSPSQLVWAVTASAPISTNPTPCACGPKLVVYGLCELKSRRPNSAQ